MSEYVVVLMTASDEEEAAGIAGKVVGEKLAACCNILPKIRSVYTWKGEVCDEGETLCVMKTRRDLVDRLTERVTELHSYDVPEVIALDISGGQADYLSWIGEVTV